ncbi:MAG: MOSC domain-containing protein [Planctomycetota bacterium]|jgi:MOSC domain-containing protein YiiM
MKITSVNVSRPREVEWKNKKVLTGIFKEPVKGVVAVRTLNLEGDQQADLSVHGGPDKAVYVYPAEHYDYWRQEYPDLDMLPGLFGENLTTEGLREDGIFIGDRFSVGTATLAITGPRVPCFKFAIRIGHTDIVRKLLVSGRCGFYCRVEEEGHLEAGDTIDEISRGPGRVSVADIFRLYATDKSDADLLRRAIVDPALGESWRGYFEHQLRKLGERV